MAHHHDLPPGVHRFAVPGGWIYYGAALASPVLVSDPAEWRHAVGTLHEHTVSTILAGLSTINQEIKTMSGTISTQIDAVTVKFQADVDAITSQIADLHAQITALQGGLTPGATITQAQVDALAAIETQAAALATPVGVVPPPVYDPNDLTANGSLMADGVTVRNTPGADPANPLPGYNPALPMTT